METIPNKHDNAAIAKLNTLIQHFNDEEEIGACYLLLEQITYLYQTLLEKYASQSLASLGSFSVAENIKCNLLAWHTLSGIEKERLAVEKKYQSVVKEKTFSTSFPPRILHIGVPQFEFIEKLYSGSKKNSPHKKRNTILKKIFQSINLAYQEAISENYNDEEKNNALLMALKEAIEELAKADKHKKKYNDLIKLCEKAIHDYSCFFMGKECEDAFVKAKEVHGTAALFLQEQKSDEKDSESTENEFSKNTISASSSSDDLTYSSTSETDSIEGSETETYVISSLSESLKLEKYHTALLTLKGKLFALLNALSMDDTKRQTSIKHLCLRILYLLTISEERTPSLLQLLKRQQDSRDILFDLFLADKARLETLMKNLRPNFVAINQLQSIAFDMDKNIEAMMAFESAKVDEDKVENVLNLLAEQLTNIRLYAKDNKGMFKTIQKTFIRLHEQFSNANEKTEAFSQLVSFAYDCKTRLATLIEEEKEDFSFDNDHGYVLSCLGGSNNINWLAKHKENGWQYVVRVESAEEFDYQMMRKFKSHPQVAPYLLTEHVFFPSRIDSDEAACINPVNVVVTDFCAKGDLRSHRLQLDHENRSETDKIFLAINLTMKAALALSALFDAGYIYLDTKAGNFLLTEDKQIKIADLKSVFVKTQDGRCPASTLVSTNAYRPPELTTLKKGDTFLTEPYMVYQLGLMLLDLAIGGDEQTRCDWLAELHGLPVNEFPKVGMCADVANLTFNQATFSREKGKQLKVFIQSLMASDVGSRPSLAVATEELRGLFKSVAACTYAGSEAHTFFTTSNKSEQKAATLFSQHSYQGKK